MFICNSSCLDLYFFYYIVILQLNFTMYYKITFVSSYHVLTKPFLVPSLSFLFSLLLGSKHISLFHSLAFAFLPFGPSLFFPYIPLFSFPIFFLPSQAIISITEPSLFPTLT